MGQHRPIGHAVETGQVLLASVGRSLVRYRLGGAGFAMQDSVELPFPVQYACFHPDRSIAYVACSNGGVATRGDRHCLAQVALDDTEIRLLAQPLALPHRPLHAAVDAGRSRLALAYNRPAAVTLHGLDLDGLVQGRELLAEGPGLVGHFPHQIVPMPAGRDWLLTSRGDDASAAASENPGSLRILRDNGRGLSCVQTVAPNGGFGFGPRNCAFHPHRQVIYAVLERQNRLAAFEHREGSLELQPHWEVDLLRYPHSVHRPQLAGAIVIHPTGRCAYVVNRAHPVPDGTGKAASSGENSVVVFRLDDLTGEPRELQRVALNGLHARCLALSPDGTVLVAALRQAGRRSDEGGGIVECAAGFASFGIAGSGQLTFMHQDAVDVGSEQLFWADFTPAW